MQHTVGNFLHGRSCLLSHCLCFHSAGSTNLMSLLHTSSSVLMSVRRNPGSMRRTLLLEVMTMVTRWLLFRWVVLQYFCMSVYRIPPGSRQPIVNNGTVVSKGIEFSRISDHRVLKFFCRWVVLCLHFISCHWYAGPGFVCHRILGNNSETWTSKPLYTMACSPSSWGTCSSLEVERLSELKTT